MYSGESVHQNNPARPEFQAVEVQAPSVIDTILDEQEIRIPQLRRMDGLVLGRLLSLDQNGAVHITVPGVSVEIMEARCLCPINHEQIGKQCAVMFEQGNTAHPVVLGCFQAPVALSEALIPETSESKEVVIDGERIVFKADREIIFQCGKASIRLTQAGKVMLEGEYVLSRSYGANRIQGGSVQLN